MVILRVSGTRREENKETIFRFLEVVRRGIISDQQQKGLRSSGESAASLSIAEKNRGAELRGSAYFQQQIKGRRPGRFPPIKSILEWIDAKGISFDGISKKSLAFVIARKIAKKGTDIFLRKSPALDVKKIVKTYEPTFRGELIKAKKIVLQTAIRGALYKSAQALRVT